MANTTKNVIRPYEIIISIAAILLFGILFAVTELFKNPFIVLGVTIFILFPFRRNRIVKIILSISIIVAALWFTHSISNILIPFLVAFILAYLIDPLVTFISRKRMKRWEASLLVVVCSVLIFFVASVIAVPVVVKQFTEFIETIPQLYAGFQIWINTGLIPFLNNFGIPTEDLQYKLTNQIPGSMDYFFNALVGGVSGLFTGITIIATSLANIILIPFLTFYISKDFHGLKQYVKHLFPAGSRKKAVEVYNKIDSILGNYIRGNLLTSLYNGLAIGTGLYFIGVRYAFLLGIIAAILDLIPYFGFIVTMILSSIIALVSGGNILFKFILTILLNIAVNILENAYISPKLIGERIGLHPVILILSLLMFQYFLGFLGLLIAIPAMAIILMFFNDWLERRDAAFKHIHPE
ncbi:MAG: AI-2E family transporter [Ignavibacteriae bacterium]|nr:MAG: AI-2E family transporter [Ignavibacteriota bacterium]